MKERGENVVWLGKRATDMERDDLLALIGYLDYQIERLAAGVRQEADILGLLMEALASAPPSAAVGVKRWPFVESPGEFTERLAAAMQELPLIGAVRHVLIENPPALAQQPAATRDEAVAYTRATGPQEDMPTLTPNEYAALRKAGMGEGYRPLVFGDAAIAAANGGGNE